MPLAPPVAVGAALTDLQPAVPAPATGVLLAQCGFADERGMGCAVFDQAIKQKAKDVVRLSVVASYGDETTEQPVVTMGTPDEPWHAYFHLTAGKRPILLGLRLEAQMAGGQTITQDALVLTYVAEPVAVQQQGTFRDKDSILFTTRNKFIPGRDFTTPTQADFLCNAAAESPSSLVQHQSWKAYLGQAVPSLSAYERLGTDLSGSLVNSLGELVSDSATALASSRHDPWQRAVSLDETGNAVAPDSVVWTGMQGEGLSMANGTCNDWALASGVGSVGAPWSIAEFLQKDLISCSTGAHLYCVSLPSSAL